MKYQLNIIDDISSIRISRVVFFRMNKPSSNCIPGDRVSKLKKCFSSSNKSQLLNSNIVCHIGGDLATYMAFFLP
jgi:hypothetical protein